MSQIELNPQSIPRSVIERLGYYVYVYIDQESGKITYVGKGKGERALAHLLRLTTHRVDILAHGIADENIA